MSGRSVYNYFRDYDPQTGRYFQFDPIGLRGGPNGYLYVGARPLSFIDPMGLQTAPAPGVPVPLPPVFTPGSPENQQFVESTTQGINALGQAMSSAMSGAKLVACEATCNADKIARDALCFVAKARGGKIAQKLCLDESDRMWIECLEDCKKNCQKP